MIRHLGSGEDQVAPHVSHGIVLESTLKVVTEEVREATNAGSDVEKGEAGLQPCLRAKADRR